MVKLGTHAVQIVLSHQQKNTIRATVSEDLGGDVLLRALARRLVAKGFQNVPLVKELQKFHYIKCNCCGTMQTGDGKACNEEHKIKLAAFAQFGEFTGEYIDVTFKKAGYAGSVKKLCDDNWSIQVINTFPPEDSDDSDDGEQQVVVDSDDGEQQVVVEPAEPTQFLVVTLTACAPSGSGELLLSLATAGGEQFQASAKVGSSVADLAARLHKERALGSDTAVRIVTKEGLLLEPQDVLPEAEPAAAVDISDLIPRLRAAVASPEGDEEHITECFRSWDTDGNGVISSEELTQVLQRLVPGFDGTAVEALLRSADVNRDGVVDYDEFVAWLFAS